MSEGKRMPNVRESDASNARTVADFIRKNQGIIALGAAALIAALVIQANRYETTPLSKNRFVVTDRLLGNVVVCDYRGCVAVDTSPPSPPPTVKPKAAERRSQADMAEETRLSRLSQDEFMEELLGERLEAYNPNRPSGMAAADANKASSSSPQR